MGELLFSGATTSLSYPDVDLSDWTSFPDPDTTLSNSKHVGSSRIAQNPYAAKTCAGNFAYRGVRVRAIAKATAGSLSSTATLGISCLTTQGFSQTGVSVTVANAGGVSVMSPGTSCFIIAIAEGIYSPETGSFTSTQYSFHAAALFAAWSTSGGPYSVLAGAEMSFVVQAKFSVTSIGAKIVLLDFTMEQI